MYVFYSSNKSQAGKISIENSQTFILMPINPIEVVADFRVGTKMLIGGWLVTPLS